MVSVKLIIIKYPKKLLNLIKQHSDPNYECNFDYIKQLNELEISNQAYGIIGMIALEYWCDTPEKKSRLKNKFEKNEIIYNSNLNEKYNVDNLFKHDNLNYNSTSTALVEIKHGIIHKLISFIKKKFKINV